MIRTQDFQFGAFETKTKTTLVLLLLSFSLLSQKSTDIFPVFNHPQSKRISIEKVLIDIREVKKNSPHLYAQAVDFYYLKIAASGKNQWIEKLEEFSLDPACQATFRSKINAQIERIRTLQVGKKAPDIYLNTFHLYTHHFNKKTVLLLFYSPSCFHCTELLVDLIPYSEKWHLSVITIQVDDEMNPWTFPSHWINSKADDKVRKAYGVISTPSLFLIQTKSKRISAIPENLTELKEFEQLF